MYCTHCGTIIQGNATRCLVCGKPVSNTDNKQHPHHNTQQRIYQQPLYYPPYPYPTQTPFQQQPIYAQQNRVSTSGTYGAAIAFNYITFIFCLLTFILAIIGKTVWLYTDYEYFYYGSYLTSCRLESNFDINVCCLAFGCVAVFSGIFTISFGASQKSSRAITHASAFIFILSIFAFILGLVSLFYN